MVYRKPYIYFNSQDIDLLKIKYDAHLLMFFFLIVAIVFYQDIAKIYNCIILGVVLYMIFYMIKQQKYQRVELTLSFINYSMICNVVNFGLSLIKFVFCVDGRRHMTKSIPRPYV